MELDSAQGSSEKPFPIPKISSDFRGCSNLPETQDPESNHDHLICIDLDFFDHGREFAAGLLTDTPISRNRLIPGSRQRTGL